MIDWIYLIDLFGTSIFAISGVLTAIHKKFDLVGSLVIGFSAAVGGGTIRDMLIGSHPVGWMNDRNYFLSILAGYFIAYAFKDHIIKFKRSMFLFDTIGIGVFTILGINKSLEMNLNTEICLIMGVISACFGGVVRDVLTNEVPLIFRREIYASACLLGGSVYMLMDHASLNHNTSVLASILSVIIIRYLAIRNSWTLNFKFLKAKNPDQ